MSNAVITDKAREKLAKARAGTVPLPAISHIAVGSGGAVGGVPKVPPVTQNTLYTETLREAVGVPVFVDSKRVRYSIEVASGELVGQDINELGLFDSDGDLVIIKTFEGSVKEVGQVITFEIDDIF